MPRSEGASLPARGVLAMWLIRVRSKSRHACEMRDGRRLRCRHLPLVGTWTQIESCRHDSPTTFCDQLPNPGNAKADETDQHLSLVAACAMWAGWETRREDLPSPCVLVREEPRWSHAWAPEIEIVDSKIVTEKRIGCI